MRKADLVIVGAGPAGMAAARRAAACGLSVLLLDEQPRPGGQIWRDVERVAPLRGDLLGSDYTEGVAAVLSLAHDRIAHVAGATVFAIEEGKRVAFTLAGKAELAEGGRILLATGALERPMPVPGWTLPGVMTAGAGQILLKQSGLVAEDAVLVGSGPLLYLLAVQMLRAGTPPKALIETQTRADLIAALRHGAGALRGWRMMAKGVAMLAELRRAGVPRYAGATAIAIAGTDRAEAVSFAAGGSERRIACGTVLLHHGVVPNTQASRSIGLAHRWNDAQHCFEPETDEWGRSSADKVFIVGDGAGIGGAKAAALTGELAALAAACDLGAIAEVERDRKGAEIRRWLAGELAARPFIDRAYPPFAEALAPADSTIVCRCEEVTAGDIRRVAALGCLGPNQAKAFLRAGMGPCQGRMCGLSVTGILAAANGLGAAETGALRIRPPIKPVTLGELAALDNDLES